nr:hypothetical protein [Acetivibrio ethanolgignens]
MRCVEQCPQAARHDKRMNEYPLPILFFTIF